MQGRHDIVYSAVQCSVRCCSRHAVAPITTSGLKCDVISAQPEALSDYITSHSL